MALLDAISPELIAHAKAAYNSPPRAYHSWAHIEEVLRHLETVPAFTRPREVTLAALFHDAVYVAGRSDNETKSADLAAQSIAAPLPASPRFAGGGERVDLPLPAERGEGPVDVAYVRHLIELTARHGKLTTDGLDDDARHFLDADMAILGAPPHVFDAYDAAIAVEYAHIPKLVYRFNRNRFLKRLLEVPRIFLSDFFHQRFDAAARDNLRRALK